jgi:DNA processing protein
MAAECIGDDELAAWLRLTETPGVGPATCRTLLAAFGLPDAIFDVSHRQLCDIVSPAIASALCAPLSASISELIEKTRAWVTESGNHVITMADHRYPSSLLEITDPPPLLYVKGRPELLVRPALAIVGSRNATAQGVIDARRFAEALATNNYTVVSGLALGIDAAAHEGALEAGVGGGSTIAVIGTGADIVYPSAHRTLAHRIVSHGALVSELPLGTTASAHQFPRRNRIIAGLSRGVLVIEAAARSGSLITARLASEAGREVFAVPGSIHSPLSKGCHQLIRQGAKLVEIVEDILEEFCDIGRNAGSPANDVSGAPNESEIAGGDEGTLLSVLGFDPVSADELAQRCDWNPARLSAQLLELELSGNITRLPGGRFQRLVSSKTVGSEPRVPKST